MKCEYGCGLDALHQLKNGKHCCSKSSNSCPAIRKKNSAGVSNSYKTGDRKSGSEVYASLPEETKERMVWNKGKTAYSDSRIFSKYDLETLFVKSKKPIGGPRKQILIEERGHKCERCNFTNWMGIPITLELEHIDGNPKNNERKNLKLLCPNCHSQTPTWKRGAKGKTGKQKYSDYVIIEAVRRSDNINQVLEALDMRWGSAQTIKNAMKRHNLNFK